MARATVFCARTESPATKLRLSLMAGATVLGTFAGIASLQARADDARASDPISTAVAGLVASGEYGAAADLVSQSADETQAQLITDILNAQAVNGPDNVSQGFLSQISDSNERVRAGSQSAQQEMLNGGTGQSLMQLAMLIRQVISGNWQGGDDPDPETIPVVVPYVGGIYVNAQGVLSQELRQDKTGQVAAASERGRHSILNTQVENASKLRLVSLTRLEKEVSLRLAEGKSATETMNNLAGLTRIDYVFVYPETNEIVIGGPAEGWSYNGQKRAVSQSSATPTLQLDDLITLLRLSERPQQWISCSIDPRQENLKALTEYVAASQAKGPLSPNGVKNFSNRIGEVLGTQDITLNGVAADTRVARVMVEADYRMKLIGLGKLNAGQDVPSYFQLLAKNPAARSGSLDALRWWLTLSCDSVEYSPEKTAFHLNGNGVKCLSENEFLSSNGQRVSSGKAESVNQEFASQFTQNFDKLAAKDPVFAELRGIFDLAMVSALIQNHRLDHTADWNRGSFASNGAYKVAKFATPKHTESVVNHRVYNGKDVVVQVAGGVQVNALAVVANPELNHQDILLNETSEVAKAPTLPENRWWWDSKN